MMDSFTKSVDSSSNTTKETGYENLAIAVVLQAFKDYKAAYLGNGGNYTNRSCSSIEKFLKESWIGDFFINLDLVSLAKELAVAIDEDEDNEIIDRKIMLNPSGKLYKKSE